MRTMNFLLIFTVILRNVLGLKTNEYLIIKNLDNPIVCSKTDTIVDHETVDILRWTEITCY